MVDPLPGKIGECSEVFLGGRDLRLEAPHLTGRGSLSFDGLAADNPLHRGVKAEPVGIVHAARMTPGPMASAMKVRQEIAQSGRRS